MKGFGSLRQVRAAAVVSLLTQIPKSVNSEDTGLARRPLRISMSGLVATVAFRTRVGRFLYVQSALLASAKLSPLPRRANLTF